MKHLIAIASVAVLSACSSYTITENSDYRCSLYNECWGDPMRGVDRRGVTPEPSAEGD